MTVALLGAPPARRRRSWAGWLRPHSSPAPAVARTAPAASAPVAVPPAPLPSSADPTYATPTYPPPTYLVPTPAAATGAGSPADPLTGAPYWSVIVTSAAETEGGRATADASAASLCDRGFTDTFVVLSSTVPSLNSGYWVEMETTGKYAHRDYAAATSTRVIAAGFAGAYPRCFGSSATACGS